MPQFVRDGEAPTPVPTARRHENGPGVGRVVSEAGVDVGGTTGWQGKDRYTAGSGYGDHAHRHVQAELSPAPARNVGRGVDVERKSGDHKTTSLRANISSIPEALFPAMKFACCED